MDDITYNQIKTLLPLTVSEEDSLQHLKRAHKDYKDVEFEDAEQKLEVVGCKTIYYLAPLLWIDMQNRVEEYAESLGSFKDIQSFRKLWLDRAESALKELKDEDKDEIVWLAI